jgi:hypothetical protein
MMLLSRMMQGWTGRVGLLALGAALLLPAAAFAQSPDDAKIQRDREIAELKAKIDGLTKEVKAFEALFRDPSTSPEKRSEYQNQTEQLRAQLAKLMKDRPGAEFAGYAQEAEKEVAQARLKELQAQLAQQADRAKRGETDSLEAQLKRIEAVRQQRAAEVQELEAKIREMSAKLKATQSGRQPAGQAKDQAMEWRFEFAPGQTEAAEEIVLRKVNSKWEVVNPKAKQPEQPRFRLAPSGFEPDGRRIIVNPIEIERNSPNRQASPNSRIDELEKKIDKALQQLEQMRRDMNRGRPGAALTPEVPNGLRLIIDGDLELQDLVEPTTGRPGGERK